MKLEQYVGKYKFSNKNEFDFAFNTIHLIDEDGLKTPKFRFSKPCRVLIPINKNTYDSDFNIVNEATFEDGYNVDICWFFENKFTEKGILIPVEHPVEWKKYALNITNEGHHGYSGVKYLENKI